MAIIYLIYFTQTQKNKAQTYGTLWNHTLSIIWEWTARTLQQLSPENIEYQQKTALAQKVSICSKKTLLTPPLNHLPLFNLPPAHYNRFLCVLSYYC